MKKMKKIIAILLAVVMVCIGFAACSKSADEGDTSNAADTSAADSDAQYVINKGKLVVGITDYAPMDYKENGSDEWIGFDADLARIVGEKLGVEVEFVEIDWDNKFIELETKAIDCIWNGMTITDEVKLNTSVSNAYAMNAQMVVMKADKASQYTTTDSLKELTFAVENGSAGQSVAEELGLEATAVSAQSDTLLEVEAGSVDAAIIDSTMADAMTGEGTDYSDLASAIALNKEEYGIGFRKDSDLTEKVNALLEELKADGTLDELAEKYSVSLA